MTMAARLPPPAAPAETIERRLARVEADLRAMVEVVAGVIDRQSGTDKPPPRLSEIRAMHEAVVIAADQTGITADLIYSEARTAAVAEARQIAYAIAHARGMSIAAIGRAMARDHTTVMHGLRAASARQL